MVQIPLKKDRMTARYIQYFSFPAHWSKSLIELLFFSFCINSLLSYPFNGYIENSFFRFSSLSGTNGRSSHCFPHSRELLDQQRNLLHTIEIQTACGFIKYQKLFSTNHADSNRHPLLLSPAECVRMMGAIG